MANTALTLTFIDTFSVVENEETGARSDRFKYLVTGDDNSLSAYVEWVESEGRDPFDKETGDVVYVTKFIVAEGGEMVLSADGKWRATNKRAKLFNALRASNPSMSTEDINAMVTRMMKSSPKVDKKTETAPPFKMEGGE